VYNDDFSILALVGDAEKGTDAGANENAHVTDGNDEDAATVAATATRDEEGRILMVVEGIILIVFVKLYD